MPASNANAETVVVTETGAGKFQVEVKAGKTKFFADEPENVGGLGSGPNPYDLLAAALGSCTAMTMRLYADRKNWPLKRARVMVSHSRSALQARDVFNRDIHLEGPLDDTQRARLIEIAERCPVHVTLQRGSDITTHLVSDSDIAGAEGATGPGHMQTMEESGRGRGMSRLKRHIRAGSIAWGRI